MLSNFIGKDEFLRFHDVTRFVKTGKAEIALSVATSNVIGDLRNKDILVERMYIPKTFGTDKNENVTKTTSFTSDIVTGGNELRFVVDVVEGNATFILQGSYDQTIWVDVPLEPEAVITVNEKGRYSALYNEKHLYYRYKVEPLSDTTYSAFLVETSADRLIRYAAITSLLLPLLGNDGAVDAVYQEAKMNYGNELKQFRYDYDEDGSLSIDSNEQSMNRTVMLFR
jgi:hypothetical protein